MPGAYVEALSSADETAKPVLEAVLPLSPSLSSGGNTTIRSDPYSAAQNIVLNCRQSRLPKAS
jgi:hypothetical protein